MLEYKFDMLGAKFDILVIWRAASMSSVLVPFKAGMHNSDLMAGQKNVADTFAGKIG